MGDTRQEQLEFGRSIWSKPLAAVFVIPFVIFARAMGFGVVAGILGALAVLIFISVGNYKYIMQLDKEEIRSIRQYFGDIIPRVFAAWFALGTLLTLILPILVPNFLGQLSLPPSVQGFVQDPNSLPVISAVIIGLATLLLVWVNFDYPMQKRASVLIRWRGEDTLQGAYKVGKEKLYKCVGMKMPQIPNTARGKKPDVQGMDLLEYKLNEFEAVVTYLNFDHSDLHIIFITSKMLAIVGFLISTSAALTKLLEIYRSLF